MTSAHTVMPLPTDVLLMVLERLDFKLSPSPTLMNDMHAHNSHSALDSHSLRAFSEVCKLWASLAQPLLFRHVVLHRARQVYRFLAATKSSTKRGRQLRAAVCRITIYLGSETSFRAELYGMGYLQQKYLTERPNSREFSKLLRSWPPSSLYQLCVLSVKGKPGSPLSTIEAQRDTFGLDKNEMKRIKKALSVTCLTLHSCSEKPDLTPWELLPLFAPTVRSLALIGTGRLPDYNGPALSELRLTEFIWTKPDPGGWNFVPRLLSNSIGHLKSLEIHGRKVHVGEVVRQHRTDLESLRLSRLSASKFPAQIWSEFPRLKELILEKVSDYSASGQGRSLLSLPTTLQHLAVDGLQGFEESKENLGVFLAVVRRLPNLRAVTVTEKDARIIAVECTRRGIEVRTAYWLSLYSHRIVGSWGPSFKSPDVWSVCTVYRAQPPMTHTCVISNGKAVLIISKDWSGGGEGVNSRASIIVLRTFGLSPVVMSKRWPEDLLFMILGHLDFELQDAVSPIGSPNMMHGYNGDPVLDLRPLRAFSEVCRLWAALAASTVYSSATSFCPQGNKMTIHVGNERTSSEMRTNADVGDEVSSPDDLSRRPNTRDLVETLQSCPRHLYHLCVKSMKGQDNSQGIALFSLDEEVLMQLTAPPVIEYLTIATWADDGDRTPWQLLPIFASTIHGLALIGGGRIPDYDGSPLPQLRLKEFTWMKTRLAGWHTVTPLILASSVGHLKSLEIRGPKVPVGRLLRQHRNYLESLRLAGRKKKYPRLKELILNNVWDYSAASQGPSLLSLPETLQHLAVDALQMNKENLDLWLEIIRRLPHLRVVTVSDGESPIMKAECAVRNIDLQSEFWMRARTVRMEAGSQNIHEDQGKNPSAPDEKCDDWSLLGIIGTSIEQLGRVIWSCG
ncbi:hypothetical protein PUNSTDRAFT_42253 [Punctularia strigosozonata HHB-11173 SS5]|uniref:uncharacterized protein n=1 Tax=Punctularia strigosozonata (strain HHB-11173) TaxID=741275 RepID=UPI0004417A9E|nr:uncharacterized protein PUNSTDRAFT_42253 [Punctularia strigosozonata HHB-11173 SS5]EIN12740.1 hypothetical protein PUNSTDRAFT_42253 [Punctularia strigosozonata HHB-11173 SS5]